MSGVFERLVQAATGHTKSRHESKEDGCRDGDEQRPRKGSAIDAQGAQQRQSDSSLVGEPGYEQPGEGKAEGCARDRQDKALGKELAHDAETACAESTSHGELLGAGGGAGQQQVGEIHAGYEQDGADRGPEHNERTPQLAADVILERNWNHAAFAVVSGIVATGLGLVVVPAHVGRSGLGIALRLGKRDAGLGAADHGDDVSPIAGRTIEIEGRQFLRPGKRPHRSQSSSAARQ